MSRALVSLCALAIDCFSDVNIGVLSIVFAWIVGVYVGGMMLDQVIAGFPTSLFLTLAGLTLLLRRRR